jgi:hypothetical protein
MSKLSAGQMSSAATNTPTSIPTTPQITVATVNCRMTL